MRKAKDEGALRGDGTEVIAGDAIVDEEDIDIELRLDRNADEDVGELLPGFAS